VLLLSRTGAMEEAEGTVLEAVVKEVVAGQGEVGEVGTREEAAKVAVVTRTLPELEATIGRWRRWVVHR